MNIVKTNPYHVTFFSPIRQLKSINGVYKSAPYFPGFVIHATSAHFSDFHWSLWAKKYKFLNLSTRSSRILLYKGIALSWDIDNLLVMHFFPQNLDIVVMAWFSESLHTVILFFFMSVGANPVVENENGHTPTDYAKMGSPVRELLDKSQEEVNF